MKIENILVVGANGFVGYYLVKRLLQCKYMVIGLDCNDDNISEFLEKDNYMFIKMNLFEEDFFNIKIKIDVIVNLAAIGHGTLLSKKNEVIFDPIYVNLKITEKLFKYAISYNVKHVIQMSSASVYGNSMRIQNEEMSLELNSPYAISKATMEFIGEIYSKLYQINVISYRAFNIYGYNKSAKRYNSNIIHNLIMYAMDEKSAVIYGSPQIKRDYIYVDDVIDGIIFAIERKLESGIYNLAKGETYSIDDVWEYICELVQPQNKKLLSLKRNYLNVPMYSHADMLKMNKKGFYCKTTIKKGILNIYKLCKEENR